MKKIIMLSLALVLLLAGCTKEETRDKTVSYGSSSKEEVNYSNESNPVATIKIKDYGTVKAELYPEAAPNTVNNFIDLANSGYYNGLIFHRIVKDFVVQGGDPKGDGTGGPGYVIKGEFGEESNNKLSHTKGVLSMARTQDPDSAGSQFFIMTGDSTQLDNQYAGFGKVIEGEDILDKLNKVEVNSSDKPKDDVVIEKVTIDTKGVKYSKPEVIK